MDEAGLAEIVETVGVDWLQLHGQETAARLAICYPFQGALELAARKAQLQYEGMCHLCCSFDPWEN